MNFQTSKPPVPLRVLLINPLSTASQMIATKMLSGLVFGSDQTVHLKLLVGINDNEDIERLKLELEKCAFPCTSVIEILTDVPCLNDADIFCIISNLPNPNNIDIDILENTDILFDALLLLVKIAHRLACREPPPTVIEYPIEVHQHIIKKLYKEEAKPIKPIIFADGLVVLDIIKSISLNIPEDILFCPTPLTTIARSILADHLKVQGLTINNALVWAVNDEMFHIEIEKPVLMDTCDRPDSTKYGKDEWTKLPEDAKNVNATWMKTEFIQKIRSCARKNPYGSIFYASNFVQYLKKVWLSRFEETKEITSIGVISDGSLETVKGLPYVLPVEFYKGSWSVDKRFQDDIHLKTEIIKINKTIERHHDHLIRYCKNILKQHVIEPEEESTLGVTSIESIPLINYVKQCE